MEDVKPIPMVRDEPVHPGGPTTADVHPDEVANWRAAGWQVAQPEAATEPNTHSDEAGQAEGTAEAEASGADASAPATVSKKKTAK
jgi:hypothetical protein